jgi:hypothetical protein
MWTSAVSFGWIRAGGAGVGARGCGRARGSRRAGAGSMRWTRRSDAVRGVVRVVVNPARAPSLDKARGSPGESSRSSYPNTRLETAPRA